MPPAHQGDLLLEVRDLVTHFGTPRGTVKAVDGVSFSLERGKTLGIVGESGSGKTVTSRSVMQLLPKRNVHREGEVLFEGRDLMTLSPKEMRQIWGPEIAMIFQDPMTTLNPVMKIGAQMTESLRLHLGMGKDEAIEESKKLLRSVKIPAPERRLGEYPHQLSGGMRQRVTIAIAISCSPNLLLADEPTTALDVTVQAQILDLLAELREQKSMAMILVTHDLGVVAHNAHEIAVMYAGKIVEKAPTKVLFTDMKMPYTEALFNAIPKMEHPSHTKLQLIPGRPPDLVNPPPGCSFSPRCPYARPKCFNEEPPLLPAGTVSGHEFRCWYPVGTEEGRKALIANLREGRPQTQVAVGAKRNDLENVEVGPAEGDGGTATRDQESVGEQSGGGS